MDGVPLLLPVPPAARCARCAADLSALAPAARFCPKCGANVAEALRAAAAAADSGESPAELPPPILTPVPAANRPSLSCIVRGYANAMFKLGAHYEVRHNDHEAVRCYTKASKLGNEPAAARLADIPIACAAFQPLDSKPAAPKAAR